jgi:U3 small nucleolar RNA-associated protein 19
MHAKYRARFFYLADIFMTSSHLPQYLVAAFVKRLSRLCLTAPANAILVVLPFIGNLLIRHKSLLKMLENEEEHYIMEEEDPQKSKALESGLWEIKTLQNHSLPQVSQSAKFINKSLPQMEWNLEDYLEITPEEMFAIEAKKKIFVNVPLTFERPHGCAFAKDDILSNYFA